MPHKNPETKKRYQRDFAQMHRLRNRDKINAARRERYDPMKMREQRHGIKPPRAPGPNCDACGSPFANSRDTHLDHDHATGEFRGWLCMRCNRALGYAGDSRDRLQLLLNYLDRYELLR